MLATGTACASGLTGGDLLVTDGARRVYEYTPLGALVQTFNVPVPAWQSNGGGADTIHDVAVTKSGKLVVYDGTFSAGISSLDTKTGIWSQYQIPGLSMYNVGTLGKLAAVGDYVFASDNASFLEVEEGIVRVNLNDGTWTRFASGVDDDDVRDLTVGGDGLLYSMNGNGSPAGQYIEGYDPVTLQHLKHIELPQDFVWGVGSATVSFGVDAIGNLYLNELYGPLYKMSPTLDMLGEYHYTQTSYIDDMDRSADGTTMFTEFDGRVVLMGSDGVEIRTFDTTGWYYSQSYGAFVPVPEPSSWLVFTGLTLGTVLRRRRSRSDL